MSAPKIQQAAMKRGMDALRSYLDGVEHGRSQCVDGWRVGQSGGRIYLQSWVMPYLEAVERHMAGSCVAGSEECPLCGDWVRS